MSSFARARSAGRPALPRWQRAAAAVMLSLLLCHQATSDAAEGDAAAKPAASPAPTAAITTLLTQHCLKCHSGADAEGEVRLDELAASKNDETQHALWQRVLAQLKASTMPPADEPQPSKQARDAATTWITQQLAAASARQREAAGRTVLRRLNRIEYEHTIRDLLGIQIKIKEMLPEDSSAAGFDNVGEALHTSSFLMERYLEAAEAALDQAIVNLPPPPTIQKRYSLQDAHQVRVTRERVYRKLPGGTTVLFTSSPWQTVRLSQFYPADRGRYRFRISASAIQSDGKPVIFRVLSGGQGVGGEQARLIGYFDAPPGEPRMFEFVDFMEPRTTISILPYGLPSAQTVSVIGADTYDGPGLAVNWVEVEGPLNEVWPPVSHRRIFGDLAQAPAPVYNMRKRLEVVSENPTADARQILLNFARRAFRRSVYETDIAPFLTLFQNTLNEGQSFEQAVRVALAAILVSPDFLFLREKPGRLDDFALASRLSYFFWSSLPDDELLTLAEANKLSQPQTLRAQVERMLADPKAQRFTESFVGQWLGLREIDATEPSRLLYPEFDEMLKVSMVREAELFFAELLKDDLSIANFIDSDFSMLNGRLAAHYGIPGVDGWEFRKVALPPDSHRGGVMTMAAVLKVTANGTHTSPVMRGVWVLDRMLNRRPPNPPENVAGLEPDIRGATTIREQLAKHRELAACASCHRAIDPPGFALENFDVIGGWRDYYRVRGAGKSVVLNGKRMSYSRGPEIDPADTLPDGRAFRNIDELKQLLLADQDEFARAFTSKLITYATGSPVEAADEPAIEAILAEARKHNYGFRSLIHAIVQSELFRSK